jgi:ubiquitin-conjugating enzyme E2 J1
MSKSPSLRRIQADIRELSIDPSDQYTAAPLEHDMFEWHFTIRGASGTDFEGGVYHGRILLPPEYPFKPPNIVFLTPSGRFETNTKVCLSFSSFHPELWQPAWGIRLILEALISFLPTPADGAIGALDWTKEERVKLARESVKFRCPVCCERGKTCVDLLPELKPKNKEDGKKTKFHDEIEKLKMLQFQNHAVEEDSSKESNGEESHASKSAAPSESPLEESKPSSETKLEQSAATNAEKSNQEEGASLIAPDQTTNISAAANNVESNTTPAPSPVVTDAGNNEAAMTAAHPGSIEQAPLVSDHFLNGMIAILAFVVVVLLRQAHELVDELRSLEN